MKKVLTLAVASVALVGCWDYSSGERVGILQKFSKKGFICKTYEGQLTMFGGATSTNSNGDTTTQVSNMFEFTVEDSTLVPQVESLVGKRVVISYTQEMVASPCRTDSKEYYFVTAIKQVQ